jgi:hypothetical protein
MNRVDRAREGLPHGRFRAQSAKRTFHDSEACLLWSLHGEPLRLGKGERSRLIMA